MTVRLKTYKRKPSPSLHQSQFKDQSTVISNYLANELQELENVLGIQEQADGEKTQTLIDLATTVGTNTAAITSEATTRSTADTALAALVTTLTATVTTGDSTNAASITSEATARADADSALASSVDTVAASVVTEAQARESADGALTSSISTVASSVTTEATARADADSSLASNVSTVAASVVTESTNRANADTALSTDITTVASSVTTEQTARANADTALASDITTLTSTVTTNNNTLAAAVSSEASTRASADSAAASSISTVSASVATEATARADADTAEANARSAADNTITASVTTEASARVSADNALAANVATAIQNAGTAQAAADGKIDSFYQDSAPSTASEGDLWFDTNDGNKIYTRRSNSWVVTQDSAIAQAISDASDAQDTADGKIATFYQDNAPTAEGAGDMWVDTNDSNKLYRWSGSTWVSVQDSNIPTILLKHGVTLNANGYITGFEQNNDGTNGTFKILADKFTIVDPSDSAGEAGTQVFDITGGVVTINGSLVVNGSLNVAGKASSGSVGAISGTAGNDVTMTSYSEISQTNFVNAAPQHIAAANHSDGSVSAGDVMGGTPLYSFTFTTYAFSGTKDFIISTLLDPIGYYGSASSTGFAFAMKATTSATDYASTSASAYVSTKGTSKGGTLSSQNYMLSDVVSLSGNTQYYIWVFGVMDDVGTSGGKRGIRDGQITVAGLNI